MKMPVLLVAWSALVLSACAGDPPVEPPPPPTIVNLQIEGAGDINPGNDGQGSPLMLKIYELREGNNFKNADFFALFNSEQATLAGDVVRKQELLLKPGDSKKLTLQPAAEVSTLGFFAAFRQLDTAQWRALTEVVPHQTKTLSIKLKANQLSIEAVESGEAVH